MSSLMMAKKILFPIQLVPSCILLIPAAAMLFKVRDWVWSPADFVLGWIFIGGTVAAYKFVTSKTPNGAYRLATGLAVLNGLVLLWINAAVGLIGRESNPANLM